MENETPKHLIYFKVENFKCFDSLELNDISQFNLILGDNNVGKTSVLEALLFDELPYNLLRYLFSIFLDKSKIYNVQENIGYLDFFVNSKNNLKKINYEYGYKNNNNKLVELINLNLIDTNTAKQSQIDNLIKNTHINSAKFPNRFVSFIKNSIEDNYSEDFSLHIKKDENQYFPFIKSNLIYQDDIVDFYSLHISKNIKLKEEFIASLHILSENIFDLIIDTTTVPNQTILTVLFNNGQKELPLFMMGDGTIRLVRLILEIIVCKNQRLMIDEIDNGMHFSRMKKVWEVVLKVAKKNNTQLFITTHDAECLRAFKEVLESDDLKDLQQDVASYTLVKSKQKETKAVRFNFEEFEHAIDYSLNIRG